MANKKCPKCGEDNPAEAVMCWACYTPLTATAGATMGAGAGMGGAGTATLPRTGAAVGVPGAETKEKKEIDPKIFFVAGGLLLAGVIALFTTGVLGGSSPTYEGSAGVDPTMSSSSGTPFASSGGTVQSIQPVTQQSSPTNTGTNTSNVGPSAPAPPSYSMIVSPNPKYATAAFAIAPSQPNLSPQQAANLARQARQTMANNGKWTSTQIVVFATPDGGQAFRQFMSQRRGAPLGGNDFANLASQGVWDSATVFYETRGKSEKVSYPAQNPKAWWGRA